MGSMKEIKKFFSILEYHTKVLEIRLQKRLVFSRRRRCWGIAQRKGSDRRMASCLNLKEKIWLETAGFIIFMPLQI